MPGDEALLQKISMWMAVRFVLNTNQDWKAWTFIVGAAAHLEHLALALLWEKDGRPVPFESYQPRITLRQAAGDIARSGLLDSATIDVLYEVADVRNSVSHRNATWGVASAGSKVGIYKGRHLFTDLVGLEQLVDDVDSATLNMTACLDGLRSQN